MKLPDYAHNGIDEILKTGYKNFMHKVLKLK